jgi:hypothetical protein
MYLQRWWEQTPWSQHQASAFGTLIPGNKSWCPDHQLARPKTNEEMELSFHTCSKPLAEQVDTEFRQYWQGVHRDTTTSGNNNNNNNNYSPIYASLPVHRVTYLRDPFSWLVSKFFWNDLFRQRILCDDIQTAITAPGSSWAYQYCAEYISYLCGDDCLIRLENNMITVHELEAQATSNLRHAFSVIGLFEQGQDRFFQMVSKRIAYVNFSLHPHVEGARHANVPTRENLRGKRVFGDPSFQKNFTAALPLLAVLERLYQVGVEVNRFQQEELENCREK